MSMMSCTPPSGGGSGPTIRRRANGAATRVAETASRSAASGGMTAAVVRTCMSILHLLHWRSRRHAGDLSAFRVRGIAFRDTAREMREGIVGFHQVAFAACTMVRLDYRNGTAR